MIRSERITFALNNIPTSGGWEFETFCNAFLSSEIENLRPVGGLHDAGRDAYIHRSDDHPNTYAQYSVTESWERKIKETISTIRSNGYSLSELVYCTNRRVVGKADNIRKFARREGVALDIRDQAYFVSRSNSSESTRSASEELALKFCDPITAQRKTEDGIGAMQADPEKVAIIASLSAELEAREDGKSLESIGLEALLEYSLRDATGDDPKPRAEVYDDFLKVIRTYPPEIVKSKVDGLLVRLSSKGGRIKHHRSTDSFTLEHRERIRIADRHAIFAALREDACVDVGVLLDELIPTLGIDYDHDREAFVEDACSLARALLYERAEKSIRAVSDADFSGAEDLSVAEFVFNKISDPASELRTSQVHERVEQFDILPQLVENVLKRPTGLIRKYLSKASRTYEFLFAIQEIQKIREAISSIVSSSKILLDTNILIPCFCDYLKDAEDRTVSQMIKQCKELDTQVYATEETISELASSLSAARSIYNSNIGREGGHTNNELVDAFNMHHGSEFRTFSEFIDVFAGTNDTHLDLKEFLEEELGVFVKSFEKERETIDQHSYESLWPVLLARRHNPKRYPQDLLEGLSRNDAKIILLTEQLRKGEGSSKSWWLLTRDRRLQAVDHERTLRNEPSLTMNPNYFVKYLGLYNRREDGALPLVFDLSEKGYVPDELVEGLNSIEEETKDLPPYRQNRMIRDYMSKIKQSSK
ncbi:MAG: hypothetical protein AAGJ81_06655 [Verrucomicrobiota bacterium]